MKIYKKITAKELLEIIRDATDDHAKGDFELSGIPRGLVVINNEEISVVSFILDEGIDCLALVTIHVKNYAANVIHSRIKAAGEMERNILVRGILQAGGISKKNPHVFILASEICIGNLKMVFSKDE